MKLKYTIISIFIFYFIWIGNSRSFGDEDFEECIKPLIRIDVDGCQVSVDHAESAAATPIYYRAWDESYMNQYIDEAFTIEGSAYDIDWSTYGECGDNDDYWDSFTNNFHQLITGPGTYNLQADWDDDFPYEPDGENEWQQDDGNTAGFAVVELVDSRAIPNQTNVMHSFSQDPTMEDRPDGSFVITGMLSLADAGASAGTTVSSWSVLGEEPGFVTGVSGSSSPVVEYSMEFDTNEMFADGTIDAFVSFGLSQEASCISYTEDVTFDFRYCTVCPISTTSNTVNLNDGSKIEAQTDFAIPGIGMDWVFSRTYNSKAGLKSIIGCNWSTNWDRRLSMQDRDGDLMPDLVEEYDGYTTTVAAEYHNYYNDAINPETRDLDGDLVTAQWDPDDNDSSIPRPEVYSTGRFLKKDKVNQEFPYRVIYLNPIKADNLTSEVFGVATTQLQDGSGFGGAGRNNAFFFDSEAERFAPGYGNFSQLNFAGINTDDWGSTYTMVRINPNGTKDTYYGFHSPPKMIDGRLKSVQDAKGHTIELKYDHFGRIAQFIDTIGRKIDLTYWDDAASSNTAKANLLKQIADFTGRSVQYDYDDEANLTSVDVFGRKTRYEYTNKNDFRVNPIRWHQLTKVFLPREVAAAEDSETTPVAYKTIEYDSSGRVIAQFIGAVDDEGTTVSGGMQTFAYFGRSHFEEGVDEEWDYFNATSGLNRVVRMTRHTDEAGSSIDHYFNIYGQAVYTVAKRENGPDLVSHTIYKQDGLTSSTTNAIGVTSTNEYLAIEPTGFAGLGQRYRNLISKKTNGGCGCGGGGGSANQELRYVYEPLTGAARVTYDAAADTTATRYFDYQEMELAEVKTELAKVLFGTDTTTTTQESAVEDLLEFMGVEAGLGDLNGDGVTTQVMGNVVRIDLPELPGQPRHAFFAYDAAGRLIYQIDAEDNRTEFEYYTAEEAAAAENPALEGAVKRVAADVDYTPFTSGGGGIAVMVDPANRNSGYASARFVEAAAGFDYDLLGRPVSYTNPLGVTAEYAYNAHDEITSVTRAAAVEAADAELGFLAYGYQQLFDYDAGGNLKRVLVEDRQGTTGDLDGWIEAGVYGYDIKGLPVAAGYELDNSTAGTSASYYYTPAGRLGLVVSPGNKATLIEYADRRVARVTRGVHELTTATFAALAGAPEEFMEADHFDSNGEPSTYHYFYNDKGQLAAIVDAEDTDGDASGYGGVAGDVTRLFYDDFGRVALALDALGNEVRVAYDERGLRTDVTVAGYVSPDADSTATLRRTHLDYDALGRVRQVNRWVALPDGVETSRTISLSGGTLDEKPAEGEWVAARYEYDRAGRVVRVIDDRENEGELFYDGLGRVVESSDPLGNLVERWYDDNGNVIETKRTDAATTAGTDSEIFCTTNYYDSLNRLITTFDNLGQAADYRYNSLDLLLAAADANGPDPAGRTMARRGETSDTVGINDFGNVTLYAYDSLGRMVQSDRVMRQSGLGAGARIGADFYGQSEPLFPDETQAGDGYITARYEYDAGGLLAGLIDDNGNKSVWEYDNQQRVIALGKGYSVTPALADRIDSPTTITISYDKDGNPSQRMNEDGTIINLTYNSLNKIVQRNLTPSTNTLIGTTQQNYIYDSLGQLLRMEDNNGLDSANDVIAEYAFDSLGRNVEERQWIGAGPHHTVARDFDSNQLSSLEYPDESRLNFTYHSMGLLESITQDGDSDPFSNYDYIGKRVLLRSAANGVNLDLRDGSGTHYDAMGKPLRFAHLEGGIPKIGFEYTYDRAGNKRSQRLLHDRSDSERYAYDSANRLTAFIRGDYTDAEADYCDLPTTQTASGNIQARSWTIDGAGNWVELATLQNDLATSRELLHTSFNEFFDIDGSELEHSPGGELTSGTAYRYLWDAQSRLAAVLDDDGTTVATYLYDAQSRRVRKDVPSSAALTLDFAYSGWRVLQESAAGTTTLQRRYDYGAGLDEILSVQEGANRYYYQGNSLGSIYGLTDSSGDLAAQYAYDPYGALRVLQSDGPQNPVTYTAHRFDPESGLYYQKYRYYNPQFGRFLSRDPIGFRGGKNLYHYASNNPLKYSDPYGLTPWTDAADWYDSILGIDTANDYYSDIGIWGLPGNLLVGIAQTPSNFLRIGRGSAFAYEGIDDEGNELSSLERGLNVVCDCADAAGVIPAARSIGDIAGAAGDAGGLGRLLEGIYRSAPSGTPSVSYFDGIRVEDGVRTLGETDIFGNIAIYNHVGTDELIENTLNHERLHQILSVINGDDTLSACRRLASAAGYENSNLLRMLEEILAELFAGSSPGQAIGRSLGYADIFLPIEILAIGGVLDNGFVDSPQHSPINDHPEAWELYE